MSDHTEAETDSVLDLTETSDQPESNADRPVLTIRQAADAADVSDKTIRRRLDAEELPGAYLDETGPTPIWRIPVDALLAAGFTLHAPTPPDPDPERAESESAEAALRTELDRARARIADLETRAEVAEAIANERAQNLDDLRGAMRMLEAAQPTPPPPTPVPEAPRRRWWNR